MQNCNFAQFYFKIICANNFFIENLEIFSFQGGHLAQKTAFTLVRGKISAYSPISSAMKSREIKMKNKNFFMLPNRIFSLGLKPKEFTVYCCLVRHSDKDKSSCFPSRRLIAQECNMDKKTVDSAISLISTMHSNFPNKTECRCSRCYFQTI